MRKMKKMSKFVAVFLVFAMALTVLPYDFASALSSNEEQAVVSDSGVNHYDITDDDIVCELTEKRESNVKHFQLIDGTTVAAIYENDVHELNDSGKYVDIDNSLSMFDDDQGDKSLIKNKGDFKISFAKKIKDDKLLTIKTKDGNIKWSLNNISTSSRNVIYNEPKIESKKKKITNKSISGTIYYEDVMEDVDLQYQLIGQNIKENIILKNKSAAKSFEFTLDTGKMYAKCEDNSIVIYNENNEVIYTILAPYMVDSADQYCNDITVSLVDNEKEYTVIVTPNMDWLNDESREYPVIIDPTITNSTKSTMNSTSVISKRPTSKEMYTYGALYIGRESSTYGNTRGVFKFDLPENISESDMITNAYVKLTQLNYYGTSTNSVTINAHKITSDLALNTLTWNGLSGNYDEKVLDNQVASSATKKSHFKWDITSAVKDWYENDNNYGLAFISENEGSTYKYATFYNAKYTNIATQNMPNVVITYVNSDGVEDNLTYHNAGSDTMGAFAVGDFNGNLIYEYNDLSMDGNFMPVSISHVFNNSKRTKSNIGGAGNYGYGMQLNLSQRIDESDVEGYTYKFTDEDGTVHYFSESKSDSSVHEKEFETTTTITEENDGTFTLSYGSTVEYKFTSTGYLKHIVDTSNNKQITLDYNSSNQIVSVTDGAGRVISLTYDSDGYLTGLTDPSSRTTTYTYTNGYLSTITRPDEESITLTWTTTDEDTLLTRVTDIDGSSIAIGYLSSSPKRVSAMTEYGSSGTLGNSLTWSYGINETTVTDSTGNSETMMFDDEGHTVCIRDGLGNAVFGTYGNTNDNNKNSLSYQSDMQRTVTNLLTNHGFEGNTISPWTVTTDSTDSVANVNTNVKYTGSGSMAVASLSSSSDITYTYAAPQAVKGNTYTFSAYVKTDFTENCSSDGVYLAMAYKDTSGNTKTVTSSSIKSTSGWKQLHVSLTVPDNFSNGTLTLQLRIKGALCTAFFDNLQYEIGSTVNRYNMLENGHFSATAGDTSVSGWTGTNLSSSTDVVADGHNGTGFKICGASTKEKYLSQTIALSGTQGDYYTFGAWAKGQPLSLVNLTTEEERLFGVTIRFTKADGTYEDESVSFTSRSENWQYLAGSVTAPCAYTSVIYILAYNNQKNYAIFDDAQLNMDRSGATYTYDANGRVLTETNSMGQTTTYTYWNDESADVKKVVYSDGNYEEYTYDSDMNVTSYRDIYGNITNYQYDEEGNIIESSESDGNETIEESATYNENYVSTTTDELGNTIKYDYDQNTGVLNSVIAYDSNSTQSYFGKYGYKTNYTYDPDNDNLLSIATDPYGDCVSFTYSHDKLSTIIKKNTVTTNDIYYYTYDEFGNIKSVKVGPRLLVSYTYGSNNGNLTRTTYGNNDYVDMEYDAHGRMTSASYNDDLVNYSWSYGADGKLLSKHDYGVWTYQYNLDGTISEVICSNGTSLNYSYDSKGNLISETVKVGQTTKSTNYYYDSCDQVDYINYSGSNTVDNTYDSLQRKSSQSITTNDTTALTTSYQYVSDSSDSTTSRYVKSITNTGNEWSDTYSYTYDDRGNISTVSDASGTLLVRYSYDQNGCLREEYRPTEYLVYCYYYDNAGNIISISEYYIGNGETPLIQYVTSYTYGNSQWNDLLTAYNGNAITYDTIGNPLNYYNGMQFSWIGRQMMTASTPSGTSLGFNYNSDGLRIVKYNAGVYTNYTYNGDSLVHQTDGTDEIWFSYDESGSPVGIEFNSTQYYYVKNIQGDIVGIVDTNGNKVVEYGYNAWGKLLFTSGSMASTLGVKNPLRYRGYYYDIETGLYYLQSRYYDPNTMRFINADDASYIGADGSFVSYNLFAYCGNNPVNYQDSSGEWLVQAICGVAGATVFGVVANKICKLLGLNKTTRRLVTAGFALIGGILGVVFGPGLLGKIAPKALKWINKLEKIINSKSRFRPMLYEGQVAIGWEWNRKFKIMLHFKHANEPEKGMHITIQHFTGKRWRKTIPDIPLKSLGKVFINWVKKCLK